MFCVVIRSLNKKHTQDREKVWGNFFQSHIKKLRNLFIKQWMCPEIYSLISKNWAKDNKRRKDFRREEIFRKWNQRDCKFLSSSLKKIDNDLRANKGKLSLFEKNKKKYMNIEGLQLENDITYQEVSKIGKMFLFNMIAWNWSWKKSKSI